MNELEELEEDTTHTHRHRRHMLVGLSDVLCAIATCIMHMYCTNTFCLWVNESCLLLLTTAPYIILISCPNGSCLLCRHYVLLCSLVCAVYILCQRQQSNTTGTIQRNRHWRGPSIYSHRYTPSMSTHRCAHPVTGTVMCTQPPTQTGIRTEKHAHEYDTLRIPQTDPWLLLFAQRCTHTGIRTPT